MSLDLFFTSRLTLRHLRFLISLEEKRNLTRVAEALNVTPAAASKALGEIEGQFGAALFVRTPKELVPVPECLLIVDAAKRVNAELQKTSQRIDTLRMQGAGEITVGIHAPSLDDAIARTLARLKLQYPKSVIRLREARTIEMLQHLREGGLDLVISRCQIGQDDPELRALSLYDDDAEILASQLSEVPGDCQDWDVLLKQPWCLPSTSSNVRQSFLKSLKRLHLPAPQNIIELPTFSLSTRVMRRCSCLAIASKRVALQWKREEIARPMDVKIDLDLDPMAVVWSMKRPLDTLSLLFRDTLAYEASITPAW